MKDIYRNKSFWFIAVPAILALWPLLMSSVYLPGAKTSFDDESKQYRDAQKVIMEILDLDPERLTDRTGGGDFDYASAVEQVASKNNIPASKYKLSSGAIIHSSKQKSQAAKIILDDVTMLDVARFLSTMQSTWGDLQCDGIKLIKNKNLKDAWKADIDLKYFFAG